MSLNIIARIIELYSADLIVYNSEIEKLRKKKSVSSMICDSYIYSDRLTIIIKKIKFVIRNCNSYVFWN